MSRKLVFVIFLLLSLIGAAFFLASMDVEQPLQTVEKPVIGGELE